MCVMGILGGPKCCNRHFLYIWVCHWLLVLFSLKVDSLGISRLRGTYFTSFFFYIMVTSVDLSSRCCPLVLVSIRVSYHMCNARHSLARPHLVLLNKRRGRRGIAVDGCNNPAT